jgi:stress-induced morphogen
MMHGSTKEHAQSINTYKVYVQCQNFTGERAIMKKKCIEILTEDIMNKKIENTAQFVLTSHLTIIPNVSK